MSADAPILPIRIIPGLAEERQAFSETLRTPGKPDIDIISLNTKFRKTLSASFPKTPGLPDAPQALFEGVQGRKLEYTGTSPIVTELALAEISPAEIAEWVALDPEAWEKSNFRVLADPEAIQPEPARFDRKQVDFWVQTLSVMNVYLKGTTPTPEQRANGRRTRHPTSEEQLEFNNRLTDYLVFVHKNFQFHDDLGRPMNQFTAVEQIGADLFRLLAWDESARGGELVETDLLGAMAEYRAQIQYEEEGYTIVPFDAAQRKLNDARGVDFFAYKAETGELIAVQAKNKPHGKPVPLRFASPSAAMSDDLLLQQQLRSAAQNRGSGRSQIRSVYEALRQAQQTGIGRNGNHSLLGLLDYLRSSYRGEELQGKQEALLRMLIDAGTDRINFDTDPPTMVNPSTQPRGEQPVGLPVRAWHWVFWPTYIPPSTFDTNKPRQKAA